MQEKKSIYDCPVCGAKKAFNPLTKALAGGLNSKGKVCHSCGAHCTNGKVSAIVRAALYIAALVGMVLSYLFIDDDKVSYFCMMGCVVAAFLLSSLFDAFFLPMERSMRNDV